MLVEQQHHAAVLQGGHGTHPVDEEGVRHRDGPGGHDDHLVDVGHRRTLKGVPPGQDLLHIALAVAQLPDSHPVPHQGGAALLAELPPGPAGQGLPRRRGHVVETAEGLIDASLRHPVKLTLNWDCRAPS